MLEIRNLRAGYGQVQVLHGIDLDVGEGEALFLRNLHAHPIDEDMNL